MDICFDAHESLDDLKTVVWNLNNNNAIRIKKHWIFMKKYTISATVYQYNRFLKVINGFINGFSI